MTVGELTEFLKAFPADYRVLIDGYEGGLEDPLAPRFLKAAFNVREDSYFEGPHDSDLMGGKPAVYLPRRHSSYLDELNHAAARS